jgi:hypothetical protein
MQVMRPICGYELETARCMRRRAGSGVRASSGERHELSSDLPCGVRCGFKCDVNFHCWFDFRHDFRRDFRFDFRGDCRGGFSGGDLNSKP